MDELSLAESRRDAQKELRQGYECKLPVYIYYTCLYGVCMVYIFMHIL